METFSHVQKRVDISPNICYNRIDEEESLKIQEEIENSKVDTSTIDLNVLKQEPVKQELTNVNVAIAIHTLITISISLKLETVTKEPLVDSNKLVALDAWVLAHSSDEVNVYKKISEVQK